MRDSPDPGLLERTRLRRTMRLRRWFLVLVVPVLLFLTIWSVLLWRQWWLWLIR